MENHQLQFRDLLKRAVSEPGTISAAYSAFHSYSIGNQLAALVQCSLRKIPVGPISTLKDWNAKGRCVKRGEKAIWLCMPITGKKAVRDETTGKETTDHYTFFVWKPRWFVLAQTEGQEYKADVASTARPLYLDLTPFLRRFLSRFPVLSVDSFQPADGSRLSRLKAALANRFPVAQQVSPISEMLCVVLPHPHRQSFKRLGTLFPGASQDGKERNFALNCRAASLALIRCL